MYRSRQQWLIGKWLEGLVFTVRARVGPGKVFFFFSLYKDICAALLAR